MMGSLSLYGMLTLHVQFIGHLITVIAGKIIIKRLVITRDTTANTRCMRREYGGYGRNMLIDIEQTKTRHPFITMINDLLRWAQIKLVEALNNQSSSIREH